MDNQTRVLDYALDYFPNASLIDGETKLAFNNTATAPNPSGAQAVLTYSQQFFPNTHFYGNDNAPLGITFN